MCGLSWMSASESPGLPKSAFAPPSAIAGPLRANWYGPHRAIRTVGTRASICISSGGLCNPIPGGSSAPQHFRKKCGGSLCSVWSPGWESRKRFSPTRARRSCHGPFASFTDYWELSRFAPASTTHKRTAWWNDLIVPWKQWFESLFTRTNWEKLGQVAGTPFVCCAGGPASFHVVFPLRAPVWPPAPRGFGRPEGDLGGGTFGEQEWNSACAGPENKTPHSGAALHGEFVTGPGQAKPAIQSGGQITQFHTGR